MNGRSLRSRFLHWARMVQYAPLTPHIGGWTLCPPEQLRCRLSGPIVGHSVMTDHTAIVARLHAVATTLPEYSQPTFSPPSTQAQLDAFAESIGHPLPSDVCGFLAIHDSISAPDIHSGYFIGDSSVLSRSTSRGDFPASDGATSVFAIGSDGDGNAFVTLSGDNGPVWKWRQDIGDFLFLSDTFLGFLARVADDFDAHSRGDDKCQFM